MGNRHRLEIYYRILNISKNTVLKTHIMYKANLSYRPFNEYLTILESRGLLGKSSNTFKITDKGIEFLKAYQIIKNLLGESEQ